MIDLCDAFVIPSIGERGRYRNGCVTFKATKPAESTEYDGLGAEWLDSELIRSEEELEEEEDWLSDREKARLRREYTEAKRRELGVTEGRVSQLKTPSPQEEEQTKSDSIYTEEEEEIMRAIVGKKRKSRKRVPGYLGDCTLKEIAHDYAVPTAYLADVLCTWGVPVPINVYDRLGDLTTGEQAFAILEAINTLDNADLQDRYSDFAFQDLCDHYEIDLKDAFEFAMKEGWNLPFGIQTALRSEQEDELLRLFGGY